MDGGWEHLKACGAVKVKPGGIVVVGVGAAGGSAKLVL